MKERIKDFISVTLGSVVMAIGFNSFFLENNIVSGGVGGLAIALNALLGWSPSDFVLYCNIPLLIICCFFLGKSVFIKTVYGAIIYPLCIKLTAGLPNLTENPLLAAIFGGIILGFGLGLVFLGNSSTGGTGILIQFIHKYTPLSLGLTMAIIDGIIVGLGFVAFDTDTVMYSIIALMTITYIVNRMMSGTQSSRNVMIISQKSEEIKDYITKVADRGVTELPIIGGFTGVDKRMLMTTVSIPEMQKLESAILTIDETAFMVVMPASQVRGRGFSLQKDHKHYDEDILIPM
ncbi:TPA: YitT family protein [Streptococcus suis]|uniref:YitT family protein n=1 Tax=Streptococcus suis TaxID=1307 RepID=A0A0Z8HYJ7_STRSU|nr:YitT family protein [Streptococcus suis]MCQ8785209.1 YitT family protein [Streptococcus suis]MDW8719587.1 YitT family protein [Streptococcus suis]NQH42446.1 YitT family protein [Streptococcus suis]NQH55835.1 YitT family protein [Streptococcus suis]NQN63483.1 YitT family protein [Streptococcus suis]